MARLLANENVPAAVVTALRADGHDVGWMAETAPGAPDEAVLAVALAETRVLLTFDKDFGELVFVHGIACPGVILIRVALADEIDRVAFVSSVWSTVLSRLPGSFLTISVAGVRARPLP